MISVQQLEGVVVIKLVPTMMFQKDIGFILVCQDILMVMITSVPDSSDFTLDGDFCFEMWIKPTNLSGSRRLISSESEIQLFLDWMVINLVRI